MASKIEKLSNALIMYLEKVELEESALTEKEKNDLSYLVELLENILPLGVDC